jgi:hypothetical protein
MKSNSNNNKQKGKSNAKHSFKISSEDGFTHLTTDPSLYSRSLSSVKEYLKSTFVLPQELIDGTMEEPVGDDYAIWLMDNFPDDILPPEPVPDIDDIDLPDEILDEIDDMEVGVDPNDAAALAELQEAQAAFRASEKKKIWESLTRARMRIIGINDLQKIKRKSYMENFTENQPIEKAKQNEFKQNLVEYRRSWSSSLKSI